MAFNYDLLLQKPPEANAGSLTSWEEAKLAAKLAGGIAGGVVEIFIPQYGGPSKVPTDPTGYRKFYSLRFANGAEANAKTFLMRYDNNGTVGMESEFVGKAPHGVSFLIPESQARIVAHTIANAGGPYFPQATLWVSETALDTEIQDGSLVPPAGNKPANVVIKFNSTRSQDAAPVYANAAFLMHMLEDFGPAAAQAFIATRDTGKGA